MDSQFNLIEESWIPVMEVGFVSLRQVFENKEYRALGGSPVEKIAIFKLLMAITQAAYTPVDGCEWKKTGPADLSSRCLAYLAKWHDRFFLFGDKPFLQIPAIAACQEQDYGAIAFGVSTGNTTVLTDTQIPGMPADPEKARLLVSQMSMALGGKKPDNAVVLSPGYAGKRNEKGNPSTSRPGPSLGKTGYLHTHLVGETLLETLWLNQVSQETIAQMPIFTAGIGTAPWEVMPEGEDCRVAQELKCSLMGRLIPLARFCLLHYDHLQISEGIVHTSHGEGMVDPTVSVSFAGKKPKVLWANPDKRPWRELVSILSFVDSSNTKGFDTLQVKVALDRVKHLDGVFGVWSGGVRVSGNAGEQYLSGADDYVESMFWLHKDLLGDIGFQMLKTEMRVLDDMAKLLESRVKGYYGDMKSRADMPARASSSFWQQAEKEFQALLMACESDENTEEKLLTLRRRYAKMLTSIYNEICPMGTAKQMMAWAAHKPQLGKFLKKG